MFYSKYRPQKFSDLVGRESVSKALLNAVSKGNVAHAYFFYGPRGTGKTTVARLLAKALNCSVLGLKDSAAAPFGQKASGRSSIDVCGECEFCKAIEEGKFLDLIEIDAASNRGIDDIRALREKIGLAPSMGRAKVYIIDEVHMLTQEAFNALLKTLEEPPESVYFILCTTDPQKVPDTIKSRCVKFEFKRASEKEIVEKLKRIVESEHRPISRGKSPSPKKAANSISERDLYKIAQAAFGGFRDAETMLEEVLVGGLSVDEAVSSSGALLIDDFVYILSSMRSSKKDKTAKALSLIQKVFLSGVDVFSWTRELLSYMRSLLLVKSGLNLNELDVTVEKQDVVKEQAERLSFEDLVFLIELFSDAESKIKEAVIPTLPLEVAVVKWGEREPKRGEGLEDGGDPKPKDRTGGEIDAEGEHKVQNEQRSEGSKESGEIKPRGLAELDWDGVLKVVRPHNHSVEALLRSCKPVSFDGRILEIEAFYSFHKERLDSPKNKAIVESALSEMLGYAVKLRCRLGKRNEDAEELSDRNVKAPKVPDAKSVEDIARNVLEVFNGEVEI